MAGALRGVDKDAYLARITRGRLALYLDQMPEVICGDSLADVTQDGDPVADRQFDVVLTNPPFGAKIVAASPATLQRYDLARRWVKTGDSGENFAPNGGMNPSTPPQVLFVERCLKMVKPGGFLGAILPESIVSSKTHAYVVQYMRNVADLVAVVGMPEALFKTSRNRWWGIQQSALQWGSHRLTRDPDSFGRCARRGRHRPYPGYVIEPPFISQVRPFPR